MTDTPKSLAVIERGDVEKMSPVVAAGMAILQQHPSPEALEKLIAMQREWDADQARKKYAQALVDLKRDLPTVLKHDKTVHFESSKGVTHYKHTTLASASEQITPVLAQYGFAMTFSPSTGDRGVTVRCHLRHAGGHVEEATMSAPIDTTGPMKNPAQQAMSSITYLKRYLMLSVLGIATADMPDLDDEDHSATAPSSDRIDSGRNLRAVEWLKKQGKTVAQAQEFLGRTVAGWTSDDLDKLKTWARPPAPEAA